MSVDIKPFKENNIVKVPVKLVTDLQFGLSPHGMRLAIALIYNANASEDLFGESCSIKLSRFRSYLGLNNNPNYLKVIEDTFLELGKKPLRISKRDTKKWDYVYWFQRHKVVEDDIIYKLSEDIKPFLVKLKSYTPHLLGTHSQIKGKYSHALYFKFKMWANQFGDKGVRGEKEVSIDELILFLQLEKMKSYRPSNAKKGSFFLKYVLGIKQDAETRKWRPIKTAVKTKNGVKETFKVTLTLEELNKETDLKIIALPVKVGKSYERVKFTIKIKGVELIEDAKQKALHNLKKASGQLSIKPVSSQSYTNQQIMKQLNCKASEVETIATGAGFTYDGHYWWKYN